MSLFAKKKIDFVWLPNVAVGTEAASPEASCCPRPPRQRSCQSQSRRGLVRRRTYCFVLATLLSFRCLHGLGSLSWNWPLCVKCLDFVVGMGLLKFKDMPWTQLIWCWVSPPETSCGFTTMMTTQRTQTGLFNLRFFSKSVRGLFVREGARLTWRFCFVLIQGTPATLTQAHKRVWFLAPTCSDRIDISVINK